MSLDLHICNHPEISLATHQNHLEMNISFHALPTALAALEHWTEILLLLKHIRMQMLFTENAQCWKFVLVSRQNRNSNRYPRLKFEKTQLTMDTIWYHTLEHRTISCFDGLMLYAHETRKERKFYWLCTSKATSKSSSSVFELFVVNISMSMQIAVEIVEMSCTYRSKM